MLTDPICFLCIASLISLFLQFIDYRSIYAAFIITPIWSLILLSSGNVETNKIHIARLVLNFNYSSTNLIMSKVVLYLALVSNIYCMIKQRKYELFWGNIYLIGSLGLITATDIITMFISIEIMMICACALIFVSTRAPYPSSAIGYFFVHFTSSCLIFIGVSYLFTKGCIDIEDIAILIPTSDIYGKICIYSICIGLAINAAILPFSGWMIFCYEKSSNTGFMYLYSFTTKISLFTLLKIFPHSDWLYHLGATAVIYFSIKAIFAKKSRSLMLYYWGISSGVLITIHSINHQQTSYITSCYLVCDMILKLLIIILITHRNKMQYKHDYISNFSLKHSKILGALFIPIGAIIVNNLQHIKQIAGIYANHNHNYSLIFYISSFVLAWSLGWYSSTRESQYSRGSESDIATREKIFIALLSIASFTILSSWDEEILDNLDHQTKAIMPSFYENVPVILALCFIALFPSFIRKYIKWPRIEIEASLVGLKFINITYRRVKLYFNNADHIAQYIDLISLYKAALRSSKRLYNQEMAVITAILVSTTAMLLMK